MRHHKSRKGVVLLISMMILAFLSVWAVAVCSMSGVNVQLADNHHKVNSALSAAESGLECGRYIVANTLPELPSTGYNYVTETEADAVWATLCSQVQTQPWVNGQAQTSGNEIMTPAISFGDAAASFRVKFSRDDTHSISVKGIGTDGQVTRQAAVSMSVTKGSEILNYAVASRGRMWLTGDSTIHGDVFSSWNRADISPFNLTSDSTVEGTVNTVLTLDEIQDEGAFQLETLDEDGNPMFDEEGNRIYSPEDEIQGQHEGINYDQPNMDMPGMDISHYNTDQYNEVVMSEAGNGDIPASDTIETEYFPHSSGDYSMPRDGTPGHTSNRLLNRNVYENQTFNNVRLPDDRNALFRNCTLDGILYVDCYKSGSVKYNNVRFENCQFNGVIVSDVPEQFKWQNNCLYFTGEATFNNTSEVQEATILAPNFNVNLGNTNPLQGDNNVLTGAIVGGIVDVRGNAQIYGTIISMCDTSQWSSGYVTNIGATLDDGGSETTEVGDVGVISITPEKEMMLPSGITSPIIVRPLQSTYIEEW